MFGVIRCRGNITELHSLVEAAMVFHSWIHHLLDLDTKAALATY